MSDALTADERNWAMFANLAGLFLLSHIPFANIVAPLLVYLKARDQHWPFALQHARASLNFQITFTLGMILGIVLAFASCGGAVIALVAEGNRIESAGPPFAFLFWLFAWIAVLLVAVVANVIACVLGAIAASNGRAFHYPAIRFVS
ncbi:MAG TPA: DUF4870 domain-containing protein [Candidatus Dormibacteraeota bacterium]|nr:DUF4870 domain-containing protein [Candidatus Dormibacteraeota bacterium]